MSDPKPDAAPIGGGGVTISDSVVAKVAFKAISGIEGINALGGTSARALAGLRGDKGTPGISVDLHEGSVDIDITMNIVFGASVPAIAEACRKAVSEQVEATTGLHGARRQRAGHRRGVPGGAGWLRRAERRRPGRSRWRGSCTRLATFLLLLARRASSPCCSPCASIAAAFSCGILAVLLHHARRPRLAGVAAPAGHGRGPGHTASGWSCVTTTTRCGCPPLRGTAACWSPSAALERPRRIRSRALAPGRGARRGRSCSCTTARAVRGRVRVYARPLADAGAVGGAVDAAVRRQVARLSGAELERLDVLVKVLKVTQLARRLP